MSLFLQVNFVSRNDKADIISQHFPELFYPVFDFGETIGIRNVIDKYSSIGNSVQGIFNEIDKLFVQLALHLYGLVHVSFFALLLNCLLHYSHKNNFSPVWIRFMFFQVSSNVA